MKKILLALTALTAIAACSAAASPSAPMAMANVAPVGAVQAPTPVAVHRDLASSRPVCDIRARPTSHGVAISAVVNANDPISGDYDLVITKVGASGSSDVNQSGPFHATRGERVTLGETELGLDRGDRFHAVLTLRGADGRVCRQELRS